MEEITKLGMVHTQVQNGIGTITFYHPAHNSLPSALLRELAAAIQAAGGNEEVRVVVLKSEGDGTFCAGASFDELAAIRTFENGKGFFLGFANVINAMRTCPKFIIGRVQGKAVGGGVGIAAAADYCLATKTAMIKLSELAIGIGPFVVGPAIERKMGKAAMTELAINASEWRSAEWARERGLFVNVCHSIDTLDDAVRMLAEKLADSSPEAMRELKRVFWQGTEHWDALLDERAAISGRLVLSEYSANAIQAFKQKA